MAENIVPFPLPADEAELLRHYRALPPSERAAMRRVAVALSHVPAMVRRPARLTVIDGDRP